jgi:diphosphomevalonate decarboxylase
MLESSWSAPSNIALVKYWGKKSGLQLPANPSVSLTLSHCHTKAKVSLVSKSNKPVTVIFEGQEKPEFLPKIENFFGNICDELNFLNDYSVVIESSNTFPHSSGIASSAASMAAISLCLVSLENKVLGNINSTLDLNRVSSFARIGSGSACRSLFSGAASWGQYEDQGSDEFAHKVSLDESLETIQNKILIIDGGVKKVSSTVGHKLMDGHKFGQARYNQAVLNWKNSLIYLEEGKWDLLGSIIEEEALALHAMMMTSSPSFLLMEPNSIAAINEVREFRKISKVPLYFTLDAGPNLHLLYPIKYKSEVDLFFKDNLERLCHEDRSIDDFIGEGPRELNLDMSDNEK